MTKERAERAELLEEAIDAAATYLGKVLTQIADLNPVLEEPSTCEVYRCRRKPSRAARVLYFTEPWDLELTVDERRICLTHALEYETKFKADALRVAGRPVVQYHHTHNT